MQEKLQEVNHMINMEFLMTVIVACFATVGLEEYLKNFFKPKNKIWYAVLMLPLSAVCYASLLLLPVAVIGSILTVGGVQLCYQTFVQSFKAIIDNITNKINSKDLYVEGFDET